MALTLVEQMGPSGYVPLPAGIVMDDRTGQAAVGAEVLSLDGLFPVARVEDPTRDPGLQMSLVGGVLGSRDLRGTITTYRTPVIIQVPAHVSVVGIDGESLFLKLIVRSRIAQPSAALPLRSKPARGAASAATPAEELRAISGLPPALLAQLFGISRTAFYKWMEGATPRDERFKHLLEVLAHVKDARERLPSSIDFKSWLRTPISPDAKPPLEYLREARFNIFRGLVLRATSSATGASPVASSIPSSPLSPIERASIRERISPTPRYEDDED